MGASNPIESAHNKKIVTRRSVMVVIRTAFRIRQRSELCQMKGNLKKRIVIRFLPCYSSVYFSMFFSIGFDVISIKCGYYFFRYSFQI